MIAYQVTINGISVTASYSEQAVDEIFLPLLRKLTGIQKKKGRSNNRCYRRLYKCGKIHAYEYAYRGGRTFGG